MVVESKFFQTSDDVTLRYLEAGTGRPLILVPGWSQTARMFQSLIDDLSRDHRVIAIDMRGHGESDKPPHGYRIARLAQDLAEFLERSALSDVTLVGHSMGCAVIWSYLELNGADRISRLVIIDQAPVVTAWPEWSDDEKAECGALHSPETLFQAVTQLSGPAGAAVTADYIRDSLFSKQCPEATLAWVTAENLKMPRDSAAKLLLDLAIHDWRDVIRRIAVPTMVFGARSSIFDCRSQEWIGRQIPGAVVEIFEEDEGGSHFMWMENPAKFHALLRGFLLSS